MIRYIYQLTSNMTFLWRIFNMIGSFHNGNIQLLQKQKEERKKTIQETFVEI